MGYNVGLPNAINLQFGVVEILPIRMVILGMVYGIGFTAMIWVYPSVI